MLRVVSLVPSLTEAVALTAPQTLVGATDWCTHPADLAVERVGGSKYPDLARVIALRPDAVIMNAEENRLSDADALRAANITIYETYPQTVAGALEELAQLAEFLGAATEPAWLTDARRAWRFEAEVTRSAVIPVWRKPWVVLGRDTFAGDVLRRLGVGNVFGDDPERYPRPAHAVMLAKRPDLAVLADEPYNFTNGDDFAGLPCAFVSGRHLMWYGPSLAQAPALLQRQLSSSDAEETGAAQKG